MEEIIKACQEKGQLWEDADFQPNAKSLGKNYDCVWLRPKEFVAEGQEPHIFADEIRPADIEQGKLGDCYFLSSLAVLAEFPDRVRSMFRQHVPNDVGAYGVSFVVDGVPKLIVIDDRIPCDPATRQPLFSHTSCAPDLWVVLLEKAYAKEHGSYRAIESGVPGDALADLTGAPFRVFKTMDLGAKRAFKEIMNDDRKNYAMCAGVPNVPDMDLLKSVGLVEGHAYSLLRAHETAGGDKILQLRNPWGKVEWTGSWSDKDSKWTPELKDELGWKGSDDGTFWMATEDFIKYFDQVSVLYVDEKWSFSNCSLPLEQTRLVLKLAVPEKTRLFLTAHQRRGRTPVSLRFCVLGKDRGVPFGGTAEPFMQSETLSSSCLKLDQGEYYVVLEVFPNQSQMLPVAPFTISCYSEAAGAALSKLDAADSKVTFPFNLPEFAEKYGTCGSCATPLSGSYFSVGGKKYHTQCFCCSACKKELSGVFVTKGSNFLCKRCDSQPPAAAPAKPAAPAPAPAKPAAAAGAKAAPAKPAPPGAKPLSSTAKSSSITGKTAVAPKTAPSKAAPAAAAAAKKAPAAASPAKPATAAAAKKPTAPAKHAAAPAAAEAKNEAAAEPQAGEEAMAVLVSNEESAVSTHNTVV